jgi:hypothetical protein
VLTSPTSGQWQTGPFGERESIVFFRALRHLGNNPWEIHIGPSGHIYSMPDTLGHRENVCCTDGYRPGAAWNDRVWQTTLGAQGAIAGNIQQAGAYGDRVNPQYSANLAAAQLGAEDFSVVTLPLYAHPGADSSLQNSENRTYWPWVLLQQHLRDIGNGLIEITYIYHNFGPVAYNFYDIWGAAKFPEFSAWVASDTSGGYRFVDRLNTPFDTDGLLTAVGNTGGWMAFAGTPSAEAGALGVIYASSNSKRVDWVRFGRNGSNEWVGEQSIFEAGRSNEVVLHPGDVYYRRYFLAVGTVTQLAAAAPVYGPHASEGYLSFRRSQARFVAASFVESTKGVVVPGSNAWCALDKPVEDSVPLFLVICSGPSATGIVTSNPRVCGNAQFDNTHLAFFGWAIRDTGSTPAGLTGLARLSMLLDASAYPDPGHGDGDVWIGCR